MWFDELGYGVQDCKCIDNMGTEGGVNIVWLILSFTKSIPGPVGEVANHLQREQDNEVKVSFQTHIPPKLHSSRNSFINLFKPFESLLVDSSINSDIF